MANQSIRQAARRVALDAASQRRRKRIEQEKRVQSWAVAVLVAIRERDAAIDGAERRAGAALREMTDVEGLTIGEAVKWLGDEVTLREATRLRRHAAKPATPDQEPSGGTSARGRPGAVAGARQGQRPNEGTASTAGHPDVGSRTEGRIDEARQTDD